MTFAKPLPVKERSTEIRRALAELPIALPAHGPVGWYKLREWYRAKPMRDLIAFHFCGSLTLLAALCLVIATVAVPATVLFSFDLARSFGVLWFGSLVVGIAAALTGALIAPKQMQGSQEILAPTDVEWSSIALSHCPSNLLSAELSQLVSELKKRFGDDVQFTVERLETLDSMGWAQLSTDQFLRADLPDGSKRYVARIPV